MSGKSCSRFRKINQDGSEGKIYDKGAEVPESFVRVTGVVSKTGQKVYKHIKKRLDWALMMQT
jgi:hypothetical protein